MKRSRLVLVAILVVYVDDILVGGLPEAVADIVTKLTTVYKMTQSEVGHFLGIRVNRDAEGSITLTQDAYVERLLERFHMTDCLLPLCFNQPIRRARFIAVK